MYAVRTDHPGSNCVSVRKKEDWCKGRHEIKFSRKSPTFLLQQSSAQTKIHQNWENRDNQLIFDAAFTQNYITVNISAKIFKCYENIVSSRKFGEGFVIIFYCCCLLSIFSRDPLYILFNFLFCVSLYSVEGLVIFYLE
jgi:hypothetical protein